MTFENLEFVFYTGIFLLPGYIIKSVLDYLVPPQRHNDAKYYMFCFFFSVLNLAVWSWLYVIILTKVPSQSGWHWVCLLLITLLGSSGLAVVIGVIRQKGWMRSLLSWLQPSHPCPTAWDYQFSRQGEAWVIVTLDNGRMICGKYGKESFASSDMDNRDLYIEDVYTIGDDQKWTRTDNNLGVLIPGKSISYIEFIKF